MGIKGLMKLISEEAPGCVKELKLSQLNGRTVAIDASMALYQFLIAIRSGSENGAPGAGAATLTNEAGEVTSHIQGMFNRTIRLMEHGVKPMFIFDGKPPDMKSGELEKRSDKRAQAEVDLKYATETGSAEDISKFTKRLVRVTKQHAEDCKQLLDLMGVPSLTAPCEAEATCAELAKKGKIFASGTEDMDTLTFGTPILYRRLTFAASRKLPILEINFEKMLLELDLSHEEFIDLCILCGCDYCESIRGIGPKKAYAAIKKHRRIESYIESLQQSKPKGVIIPDTWLGENPIYKRARQMFLSAEVTDTTDLSIKWKEPQVDELTKLLVEKYGFNPDRVANAIAKLKKAKTTHSQPRLESFFKAIPSTTTSTKKRKETASKTKKKGAGSAMKKKK